MPSPHTLLPLLSRRFIAGDVRSFAVLKSDLNELVRSPLLHFHHNAPPRGAQNHSPYAYPTPPDHQLLPTAEFEISGFAAVIRRSGFQLHDVDAITIDVVYRAAHFDHELWATRADLIAMLHLLTGHLLQVQGQNEPVLWHLVPRSLVVIVPPDPPPVVPSPVSSSADDPGSSANANGA